MYKYLSELYYMENQNPLAKYYRQPKIYLSLPSKGQWWPEGSIKGDPTNLAVFGMTAMDEIMFKTPDALFTGESVVNVIKSCIPDIVDPWKMPQLDIDSVLMALRIATYGPKLNITFTCKNPECKEHNDADLDLTSSLDYFSRLEYSNVVYCDPLTIFLKPYNYREFTDVQMQTYELRRLLHQSTLSPNTEESGKVLDEFYKKLGSVQAEGYKKQIHSIEADDAVVQDANQINEWIRNSEKKFFDSIKKHLEKQRGIWRIPEQKIKCAKCETENSVSVELDNSNFFVKD